MVATNPENRRAPGSSIQQLRRLMNILIVDDQRSARHLMKRMLGKLDGIGLFEADNLVSARKILDTETIHVAMIDIRLDEDLQNRDGLELVKEVSKRYAAIPVVVTAYAEMTDIRTAMRNGAHDYILKDDLCDEMVLPIVHALQRRYRLEQEVLTLRAKDSEREFPPGMIGSAPCMVNLRNLIRRVATSDRPVLVTGPKIAVWLSS